MKLEVTIQLDFDNREELDEFVANLDSGRPSAAYMSDVPQQLSEKLKAKRNEVDSKSDLELIPELLRLVNFHLDNIYTHDKKGFSRLGVTARNATKVYFDENSQKWTTDNGFSMYSTIYWSMKWFEKSAPEYWKMPDGTKWHQ